MAFAQYNTNDYHVRVTKLSVSNTKDNTSQLPGDFNFEIQLPDALNNVIGFKLVEWSFSRDMVPTFYPEMTNLAGRDSLDFRLTNPEISPVPGDFTVYFPPIAYDYENLDEVERDITRELSVRMQEEIYLNPAWQEQVIVFALPDYAQLRTHLVVANSDPSLPTTKLTLLLKSGPSGEKNAAEALGFDRDDVESNRDEPGLETYEESLISPYPMKLRISDYLDVFVDESPQKPMQRIFFNDRNRIHGVAPIGSNRVEIDTDQPPRRLERLHIRIRYKDNLDPGKYVDDDLKLFTSQKCMTFHFFTLEKSRPNYLNQDLSF